MIVRNLLGNLKQAGIVTVRRGSGGAELAMPPEEINVWRVNEAVDPSSLQNLMGLHQNPSSKCPVGSRIHGLLDEPYEEVRRSVQSSMKNYTLANLITRYHADVRQP